MREEDTVCVGSDGLRYCKVCGEAKEAFFPEGGYMGMKKHSRQCACDRKAYEEEQKYFKDKEHRELVSRNTSICFDESRMEEWTFENADMSDAVMHRAKTYVDTGMAGSNGKYDKYFQLVKRKEFEKFISERVEI